MATYEKVSEAAKFIQSKIDFVPKVGIICGSGLSGLGNLVTDSICIKYQDIPSFVTTAVKGHKNNLLLGKIGEKHVVCMQGRFHPYEGYPAHVPAFPVRVFSMLGVEVIVITNAAGGISESFKVGDFMILKDHISFLSLGGYNPLCGKNECKFGPRFPSMLNAYDSDLRKTLKECATKLGYTNFLREGVYVQVSGPSYETIAELRMIKLLGGDAVGMSTVQEVIAARHAGIKVVACSLITNECELQYDTGSTICHEEVLETANKRGKQMEQMICKFIERVD